MHLQQYGDNEYGSGGGDNDGNDCDHHGYAAVDNSENGHSDGGEL